MRTMLRFIPVIFFAFPLAVLAFQPNLVHEDSVVITNPNVSQIYYDTLSGEARAYRMKSDDTWVLNLDLLAPAKTNPHGKFDAVVVNESNGTVASILEAGNSPWQEYYEPIGADRYFQGPKLRQELPAGNYRIVITSTGNMGKYALEIGEERKFAASHVVSDVMLLPVLKREFFGMSPSYLVMSPLMLSYAVLMFVFGAVFGFFVRRHPPRKIFKAIIEQQYFGRRNIDLIGRIIRAVIGVLLVFFAIYTTWNPAVLVVAGFCFYQAFSSWCALFGLLGRNTCST